MNDVLYPHFRFGLKCISLYIMEFIVIEHQNFYDNPPSYFITRLNRSIKKKKRWELIDSPVQNVTDTRRSMLLDFLIRVRLRRVFYSSSFDCILLLSPCATAMLSRCVWEVFIKFQTRNKKKKNSSAFEKKDYLD